MSQYLIKSIVILLRSRRIIDLSFLPIPDSLTSLLLFLNRPYFVLPAKLVLNLEWIQPTAPFTLVHRLLDIGQGYGGTHNHDYTYWLHSRQSFQCFPICLDLHKYLNILKLSLAFFHISQGNCSKLYPSILQSKTCCFIEKIEGIRPKSDLQFFFSSTVNPFIKIQSLSSLHFATE